jgi:ribosomal protein S18 acetylase RimI-like enzyme
MEKEIKYRYAVPSDALRLSILFQTVYITTYGFEGVSNEYASFISKRFAPQYIENTITNGQDSIIVATLNENLVGVAEIDFNRPCPIGNVEEPELGKLYVLDAFFGKGIGYNLMNEVEKTALAKGHKQVWLEVWDENPRAIAFYERQGYQAIGSVPFPMDDNTYTNIVMIKTLDNE